MWATEEKCNLLALGRCGGNSRFVIFIYILLIDVLSISCEKCHQLTAKQKKIKKKKRTKKLTAKHLIRTEST